MTEVQLTELFLLAEGLLGIFAGITRVDGRLWMGVSLDCFRLIRAHTFASLQKVLVTFISLIFSLRKYNILPGVDFVITMSEHDQMNLGPNIPQEDQVVQGDQQQVQVLSLDSISDIIKGELRGVKDYIEETISKSKGEDKKAELKFKGNRIQFEFNSRSCQEGYS